MVQHMVFMNQTREVEMKAGSAVESSILHTGDKTAWLRVPLDYL
jgi:hypothetical protein